MKVIYEGNLSPWEPVGQPDVKMQTKFMTAFTQNFRHPISGVTYEFSQIEIGNYLSILPITKEGNLVLTIQWKQGVKMLCPQFPGGAWPVGKDAETAACDILLAETGYSADTVVIVPCDLHFFDSRCPNYYCVAMATQCQFIGRPVSPAGAVLEIVEIDPLEFWTMVDRGDIHEPAAYVGAIFALRVGFLPLPPHYRTNVVF